MLPDFIEDLAAALEERRDNEVDIILQGTNAYEWHRGRYQGLEDALDALKTLQSKYLRETAA